MANTGNVVDLGSGDYATRVTAVSAAGGVPVVAIDQTTPGSTDNVTVATGQGAGAVIGVATSDAAITTDATGTIHRYLRGLVTQMGAVTASPVANTVLDRLKALLTGIVLAAGSNIIGKVGIDQTTPGTTNAVDTELSAAAAAADAFANPTSGGVLGFLKGFNGTTWDRIRAGAVANVAAATGFVNALAVAIYNATPPTVTDTRYTQLQADVNANLLVSLGTLISGEDTTNNRIMTEPKFTYKLAILADASVKASAGVLHSVVISSDAAATAGTLILYDNTAESGTVIATITFVAAYFAPVCLIFDCAFLTGLYAGFTTTADCSVSISYI